MRIRAPLAATRTWVRVATLAVALWGAALLLCSPCLAQMAARTRLATRPGVQPPVGITAYEEWQARHSTAESDVHLNYGALIVSADPHGGHFNYDETVARADLPPYPRRPDEIAWLLERAYGTRSALVRGVRSVATVADSADDTAQIPLEGVNKVADDLVILGREKMGWTGLPRFRFKSTIGTTRLLGIGISASW